MKSPKEEFSKNWYGFAQTHSAFRHLRETERYFQKRAKRDYHFYIAWEIEKRGNSINIFEKADQIPS